MYTRSEVFVFHDETRGIGAQRLNGHILLFVPMNLEIFSSQRTLFGNNNCLINSMRELYTKIKELRKTFNANHKFHFTDISGKKWTKSNEAERMLVKIGVDALRSKNPEIFSRPLYCKFAVIFYYPPTSSNLAYYKGDRNEKILRFNETILRMLLKGAVHYLYDRDNKAKILKIITDGQPYHRKLSEDRILWRLIEESLIGTLREYVDIPPETEIIHIDSNHRNHNVTSEEYVYANMLQLADMFLGSVIQSCFKGIKWQNFSPHIGGRVKDKKSIIAYPVKEMLDKRKRGSNFKYSGHYKSFTISKANIVDEERQFENIMTKEIVIDKDSGSITLLNFMEGAT